MQQNPSAAREQARWMKPNASLWVPVNSLIFVDGSHDWPVPDIDPSIARVWSNPSCIASACFPEIDGSTRIVMGNSEDLQSDADPVFDGILKTPNLKVAVTTVDSDTPVVEHAVTSDTTRIQVWHSHPIWPEVVTIVVI